MKDSNDGKRTIIHDTLESIIFLFSGQELFDVEVYIYDHRMVHFIHETVEGATGIENVVMIRKPRAKKEKETPKNNVVSLVTPPPPQKDDGIPPVA